MIPTALAAELEKIPKKVLLDLLWDISAHYAWPTHSANAVAAQIIYQRRFVEKAGERDSVAPDQPAVADTIAGPATPAADLPPPASTESAKSTPSTNLLPRGGLF